MILWLLPGGEVAGQFLWFTWDWKSFVLLLEHFLGDPEEVAVRL